jgi:hypothetical protein
MAQQYTGQALRDALEAANRDWLARQRAQQPAEPEGNVPLDPGAFSPGGLAGLVAASQQAKAKTAPVLPSRPTVGPIGTLHPSIQALLDLNR